MDNASRNFRHSQHPAVRAVGTLIRLVLTLIVSAIMTAIGVAVMNHVDPGWLARL